MNIYVPTWPKRSAKSVIVSGKTGFSAKPITTNDAAAPLKQVQNTVRHLFDCEWKKSENFFTFVIFPTLHIPDKVASKHPSNMWNPTGLRSIELPFAQWLVKFSYPSHLPCILLANRKSGWSTKTIPIKIKMIENVSTTLGLCFRNIQNISHPIISLVDCINISIVTNGLKETAMYLPVTVMMLNNEPIPMGKRSVLDFTKGFIFLTVQTHKPRKKPQRNRAPFNSKSGILLSKAWTQIDEADDKNAYRQRIASPAVYSAQEVWWESEVSFSTRCCFSPDITTLGLSLGKFHLCVWNKQLVIFEEQTTFVDKISIDIQVSLFEILIIPRRIEAFSWVKSGVKSTFSTGCHQVF